MVDTEELVQHLMRCIPTGTPKSLRRALLFLHAVGAVHAREVCCAPGVVNDTVCLDPRFSARVLLRSTRRVHKAVPVVRRGAWHSTGGPRFVGLCAGFACACGCDQGATTSEQGHRTCTAVLCTCKCTVGGRFIVYCYVASQHTLS